ncbi:TonB-linked outer membrane protein, SusC/RagA family [Pedobacter steynii]|uniref:TonB-linked outer membrane protein, SusC/RagA family n=1 Tax=Pedobacter steynii TaxID=430522 RepID=A0A1G9NHY1_9SPHI|nr:TonB-dependent receptor [Pedobacter steynii]NQX39291.1 TonB-dependent receptor [Pedobacter steynii]SDL86198.1 TonB-linked outer membrane protein, SusC/RagA family [Pedobacter steynii]
MRKIYPIFGTRLLLSMVLCMSLQLLYGQSGLPVKLITGKVSDQEGKPLIGVSIQLKGKTTVVSSDNNGVYKIGVPGGKGTLAFSYIGFLTKEVILAAGSTYNVTLNEDPKGLNEVIVIGYGSIPKRDLTGSVGSANMKDLNKAPVGTFSEALAGRIAGVQVSSTDGQPGNELNIIVRGANSVTQDNSPLYVIDGFPTEAAAANSINNEEIESIEVLKDASATAIYGARGANGVVIITTKKGKVGAPQLSYDGWAGINSIIKQQKVLSPYEFVKYQLELDPVKYGDIYLKDGLTLESYRDRKGINWQDEIFRNAYVQNHSLSLRGGTEQTKYSISGSVLEQPGIIINSGFRRYQGRIVVDQTINTKLKAGVNLNYVASKKFGTVVAESQTSPTASLMYSAWGFRPVTGNIDFDSNMIDELYDPDLSATADYRINPLLAAQNEYKPVFNNTLVLNSYLDYKILKNLSLRISGGLNKANIRREIFNNSSSRLGNPNNNNKVNGGIENTEITNLLNENTLTYQPKFKGGHSLRVLAGLTMQDVREYTNGFSSIQIPNESLGMKGLGEGQLIVAPVSDLRNGLLSYLGRIDYNYKSRYLFTVSFRADGSSRFPTENRWASFPSGAFAWRFTDEPFMKKLGFLSEGKLRIGYGHTGNNRVDDYAALTALKMLPSTGYPTGNVPGKGIVPVNLGNTKLKWETTVQSNVGIDLSFLKNRIAVTADYYHKKTHDLLLNATLAPSMGYLSAFKNVGKVSNSGIELSITTNNIQGEKFSWSSSFNIAFNRNKVLALNDDEPNLLSRVTWGNFNNAFPYIAVPGKPIAQFYGMKFDGVYQYSDFDVQPNGTYVLKANVPNNGNPRANILPGDIKFKDINGDNQIDDNDRSVIGDPNPVHIGGFSNNFSYGNFDLNIFLQWSYGNDVLNANRIEFEGGDPTQRNLLNMFASFANRWTPENQTNELYRSGGQGPAYYSSRTIEDGSFIRLKTVSLGYKLPASLMKSLKMRSLRFSVSAQNLITWTKYSGLDPEVSTRHTALTPGFDWSPYPRPRSITIGLNANF